MSFRPGCVGRWLACGTTVAALVGCGASDPTSSVATAGGRNVVEPLSSRCDATAPSGSVLVAGLPAESRSDVEAALATGKVAVASFDCNRLEILRQCTAPGTYVFRGTTAAERVASLPGAEAIRVAFPLGGGRLADAFKAEAPSGSRLDVGLVFAGQMVAPTTSFAPAELAGVCGGATHVVTAIKLGGFAITTRAATAPRTANDVFAAAAENPGGALNVRHGSSESCQRARLGATEAPEGCGAVVSIEMTKLAKNVADDEGSGDLNMLLALLDYNCDDIEKCEAGCNAGKGRSCTELGMALFTGTGVDKNLPRSRTLVKKACNLGDMKGCTAYAGILGEQKDGVDEAIPYAEKACNDAEEGYACIIAGRLWATKGDIEKEKKFRAKGCLHGEEYACEKP